MQEQVPVGWDSQAFYQWATAHARGHFIELGGRLTHYVEQGEGDPVILLHGIFFDSCIWEKNIDALADTFHVYALDLWGSGYSTRDHMAHDYDHYAHELRLFMERLHIRRASLVGQCLGASTAVHFAVTHPTYVERLLLVAPGGVSAKLPLRARALALSGIGQLLLSMKSDTVRRRALEDLFFYEGSQLSEADFAHATRFHKIRGTSPILVQQLRQAFFEKLTDDLYRLDELRIPVLLVWGRQDKLSPVSDAAVVQEILEDAQLEVIDQAGHVPNWEADEAFNELAIEFLKG